MRMRTGKRILVLALALWSGGCAVDAATEAEMMGELEQELVTSVTVEKVRACKHTIGCGSYVTNSQYHFWDDHNVAKDKQEETHLARMSEPAVGDVEYVAMLFAGQQLGSGSGRDLTGQSNSFKKDWSKKTASKSKDIYSGSIAAQLFDYQMFPQARTFAAAAWDARFNYNFTAGNKQEIENAYYDWLKSKFSRSRLKVIYLAGHSRAGCLALRLGTRRKAKRRVGEEFRSRLSPYH